MVEIEGEKKHREDMELKQPSEKIPGVVDINPKPRKGVTSKAVDWLEKVIVNLMYDSSIPKHFLAGNFAPVSDETPPFKDSPVKGYLPECLNGEFVRVGPNPKFAPVAGYHWFDGDGYVCLCLPLLSCNFYGGNV